MAMHSSAEIEQRLEALARESGRSVASLAREALFQRIEAIEEFYRDNAAARHRQNAGGEPPAPGEFGL